MGNGTLTRELKGNQQLLRMMTLIDALDYVNALWSIENPESSFMFHTKVKALTLRDDVHRFTFDQCMFGLAPPDVPSARIRKRTCVVTNIAELFSFVR